MPVFSPSLNNHQSPQTLNGHAEVVLSDAVKRGGPASTLTYKGKLADSNIEKRHFNYEGVVVIKLKDGKNLENNFFVKNTPQGENKLKYEFKVRKIFMSFHQKTNIRYKLSEKN